jgi:hypothetical protein
MYDVVIEKTPDGEARVMLAVLQNATDADFEVLATSLKAKNPESEYSIATAEAIALGNLGGFKTPDVQGKKENLVLTTFNEVFESGDVNERSEFEE